MSRRFARKDTAHQPVADFLAVNGIQVFDVSALRDLGFDIVGYDSQTQRWGVLEVKTAIESKARPDARAYDRRNRPITAKAELTASEQKAQRRAPIGLVETGEEALRYFRGTK